jgi:prophage regulatory protein
MDEPKAAGRRIIRRKAVIAKAGKSYPTIWRGVRNGTFPAPVVLGPNSVGWYEDEIDAWLASRPRVSYAPVRQESAQAA